VAILSAIACDLLNIPSPKSQSEPADFIPSFLGGKRTFFQHRPATFSEHTATGIDRVIVVFPVSENSNPQPATKGQDATDQDSVLPGTIPHLLRHAGAEFWPDWK